MDQKIYQQNKKALIHSFLVYGGITVLIGAALVVLMEMGLMKRTYTEMLIQIDYYVILAVSLNLVCGFLGELSLGHAAFMSVGAYLGSIITNQLNTNWMVSVVIAMVIGGVAASIFALLFRLSVLRLRGDYLAIVTLAFGEIIKSIVNSLGTVTGGPAGLKNYNNYTGTDHYLFVFTIVAISVIVISNIIKTRHGRAIRAVRDNAIAAEAMGIPVNKIRLLTFVVSSCFAGIAGVIYSNSATIIYPSSFDFNMSIDILVIAVLGGLANIKGSIVAVIVIIGLPEILRPLKDYRMVIYSIALIAIMLFNNSTLKKRLMENNKLPALLKRSKKEEA